MIAYNRLRSEERRSVESHVILAISYHRDQLKEPNRNGQTAGQVPGKSI